MRTIGEKNKTRQVSLTASGAIGQGHAVYVNSDGTVSSVNNKAITASVPHKTNFVNPLYVFLKSFSLITNLDEL